MEKIKENEIEKFKDFTLDDVGFVFQWKNKVFRAINNNKKESVQKLFNSGLITKLNNKHLIPHTKISNLRFEHFEILLEHTKINYANYPHEWSFNMLKEAAIFIVNFNIFLNKQGYETKDSHSYNVMFDKMKPKFIDVGSLVPKNKKRWDAADEFIRSYYYPLKIWSDGNEMFARYILSEGYLMSHEEYFLYKHPILKKITKNSIINKIVFYYNLLKNIKSKPDKYLNKINKKIFFFKMNKILILLKKLSIKISKETQYEKLISKIEKIEKNKKHSRWGEYHNKFIDSNGSFITTKRFKKIKDYINKLDINTLTDIGGNQGSFSKYILDNTKVKHIACIDYDENAIDLLFKRNKLTNLNITPILSNFITSHDNQYSISLNKRVKSDGVLALAITHHLILSQRIPINFIFEKLKKMTDKYVFIEFMPLGLWSKRYDPTKIKDWYTEDWFESNFLKHFKLVKKEKLEKNRVLFVGEI